VSALQFAGNQALDSTLLDQALHGVVVGEPYSERELTTIVGLNLGRLYNNYGYLRATFPKITRTNPGAPDAIVRIDVIEGPCFKLGEVAFLGDNLPEAAMQKAAGFQHGTPARWNQVAAQIEQATRVLRSTGYLEATSDAEQHFREGSDTVDLQVRVVKGKLFTFGELVIAGLDPDRQDLISRRWGLRSGAPLNGQYVNDFAREIYPLAGRHVKGIKIGLLPHPGPENVLDVKYTVE
jgi:outer membrane protein assembly factor BamA